jgi:dolichol-phosphate mannosyltransferase
MNDSNAPILSVVAPAHNEQDNIAGLVDDVKQALEPLGKPYELVLIDDGSNDDTVAVTQALIDGGCGWLRIERIDTPAGKGLGPSAGIRAGIISARGQFIAIIDADRQNDPADIPAMLELIEKQGVDLVQGDRSANRRDNIVRRVSSIVGRTFRRMVLGDNIRDSACAMRVMKAEVAQQIPLQYKGMHRFTAYYAKVMGYKVAEMPVHHRPRTAGVAKFGVWNRALPGLIDLFAVRWMRSRYRSIKLK